MAQRPAPKTPDVDVDGILDEISTLTTLIEQDRARLTDRTATRLALFQKGLQVGLSKSALGRAARMKMEGVLRALERAKSATADDPAA